MKTTIEISTALLNEAKRVAAREGTTLRALIEQGLRRALRERPRRRAFRLRKASFKGSGLRPELSGLAWGDLRDRAYEGHGA